VVSAQSIKDVRINEIQVHNTDGLRDEYGQLSGWIELFNTGYGKVNLAGSVLQVNGKEYRIPKGDPATLMATQGYMLFYAAGTPEKGLFHTNFTLENTDFVKFYDIDGNLIDSLFFNPAKMTENVSFGWLEDGDDIERLSILPVATPRSTNNTIEKTHKSELFRQADPSGIVLTITAIIVVAIALTILFLIFKYIGDYHINRAKKKAGQGKKSLGGEEIDKKLRVTNDELAAISIALYKYFEELHDVENTVLTINQVAKSYSPWNSKIYNIINQLPHRK
jgi:hypothetical protein